MVEMNVRYGNLQLLKPISYTSFHMQLFIRQQNLDSDREKRRQIQLQIEPLETDNRVPWQNLSSLTVEFNHSEEKTRTKNAYTKPNRAIAMHMHQIYLTELTSEMTSVQTPVRFKNIKNWPILIKNYSPTEARFFCAPYLCKYMYISATYFQRDQPFVNPFHQS